MRPTRTFAKFNESQRHSLDSRRNLAVRANAGSGKTSVLVERIVQILAHSWDESRPLDLTRIVAITFTRKAAGELQDRLRTSFLELAKGTEDPEEHAYWTARIEEIPRAMIGTIDSFCGRILREFGMLAGPTIEPDFDWLEEYEAELIRGEAVDRVINRLSSLSEQEKKGEAAAQSVACHWWAVNQGYDALTRHLTELLKAMVEPAVIMAAHRDLPPATERVAAAWQSLPAVRQLNRDRENLGAAFQEMIRRIDGHPESGSELLKLRERLGDALAALQTPIPGNISMALQALRQALLNQENQPRSMRPFGLVKDRLEPLQEVWAPLLEEFDADYQGEIAAAEAADRLALLLGRVYEQYLELCRQEGRFDFLTVERWTRDLLAGSPQVRKELKTRFRYVLVDEFQDTNHLQWEIISHLVGTGPEGRLDKDRLFIVGDPQQSIYRFRQAEVGVFRRVQEVIQISNQHHGHGDLPTLYDSYPARRPSADQERLGMIPLKENYRSLKKIPLQLMDRVFKHVFDPHAHGLNLEKNKFEVEYQELIPGAKSEAVGEIRYVIPSTEEPEHFPEAEGEDEQIDKDLSQVQVEAVVDQLVSLYGHPKLSALDGEKQTLSWKDMAVLLPSRSVVLTGLEKELTRRQVPYLVTSGIGFWQRQEVRDVVSLASFLADSGDELALFAVLRGPVGQLTDKQILFLSQFGLGRIHRGLQLIQQVGSSLGCALECDDERRDAWQAHWQKLTDPVRSVLTNHWQGISEKERERLRSVAHKLEGWRLRVDRMAHADLLQRCLEESGAYTIYAAEPEREMILANLTRLFDRIRAEESRSAPGLARLARWMRDQVEDSYREEQASLTAGQDAVQIMTVHAAKGLEFPVVAVMKMERRIVGGPGKPLHVKTEWDELLAADGNELGPVPPGTLAVRIRHPQRPRETYSSRLFKALRKLDQAQELAESRRLFYVAATRVKERLILAGRQPKLAKSGEPVKLQACWQKWFEEALDLTQEDKKKGIWEDAAHGFRVTITTEVGGWQPALAPSPALSRKEFHLDYLHERPRHPTIATTGLQQMRELWSQDRQEWWLRYGVKVQAHVADPPADFIEHGLQKEDDPIGPAVGSLIHRLFEMGGTVLDRPAREREMLLESMAANTLSTPGDQDGSWDGDFLTAADQKTIRMVVHAVQQILDRIKQSGSADSLRRLLQADGESEVDFLLNLGRWRVSGRFDKLLAVDEGRCEIVDWKTDQDDTWREIVKRYQPQMKLYALALYRAGRAAMVEGRVRVHLALLHHVRVETLAFLPPELEAFAAELTEELREMDDYALAGFKN
jgi:ATP-dependent helicase/nuclease subunit A